MQKENQEPGLIRLNVPVTDEQAKSFLYPDEDENQDKLNYSEDIYLPDEVMKIETALRPILQKLKNLNEQKRFLSAKKKDYVDLHIQGHKFIIKVVTNGVAAYFDEWGQLIQFDESKVVVRQINLDF